MKKGEHMAAGKGSQLAILIITVLALFATNGAAAYDVFVCSPTHVAAFSNRVHVRCSTPAATSIYYFAVCSGGSNRVFASQALSIFTTAKATGKNIEIYYYQSDTSGTVCGCQASDCRVIGGAEIMP